MDRAQLLQHFDTLAETPDAVAKLRKLVMELGVQGRLVPQQKEDGDALALLKKIDAERARRVAAKELEASPRMKTVALPTTKLPSGWVWSPFGRVNFCRDGERVPVNSDEREGLAKTYDYYGASGVIDKIDRYLFDKPLLLIGEDGANLVNRSTPIAFIAEGKYWVNNHAHVLDAIDRTLLEYLRIYINSINLEPYLTGMAQPKMNQAQMNSIPVALPPLAEQRRIVAKVEELLALCEELEARQTAAREHRTRLVRSALDHLTTAKDDSDFEKRSAFCLQQSALLFDSVPALRQAILSLAVQGHLVPQDSSEETATALVGKIEEAKRKLFQEGRLRKIEMSSPVEEGETLWKLPPSWVWTRLTDVFDVRDGTHDTPKYAAQGFPLVTSKNLYTGKLDMADVKFISADDHAKICERSKVDREDILFAMIGSIGNPVMVDVEPNFSIKNVALFKYYSSSLSEPQFLHLYLTFAAQRMREVAAGGVQSFVSLGFLRQYPFPLPPLAEQQRIVAKVDELLRWCDALEARLTAARTTATHLLDATLHQILTTTA